MLRESYSRFALKALPSFLAIYRIRHGAKISALRLPLYAFFGYAVSGHRHDALLLYAIDSAMVLAWLLFTSLVNDYYDYALLGERNAVGRLLSAGRIRRPALMALTMLPFAVMLGCLAALFVSSAARLALGLWLTAVILSVLYSAPPARLKHRRAVSIAVTPVGLFLVFLHGFMLTGTPQLLNGLIAAQVLFFVWYAELLHLVDDALQDQELKRVSPAEGMRWLRRVALLGLFVSLLSSVRAPLLLMSALAWTLRFWAIRRLPVTDVPQARRSLRHPIWQLEDFTLYGLCGLAGMLA